MKTPLKEGKQYCDICGGEGILKTDPEFGSIILCEKCKGVGQLDWIEMVVGKKEIVLNLKKMRPVGTRIGKDPTLMTIKLRPRRIRDLKEVDYEKRIKSWE